VYSPQRLIASTGIWHLSELKLVKGLFELSLANFCHDQIHDLEEMTQSGEFSALPEFGLVGMGIGGGINNTEERHVLTFDPAMKSSKHREWKDAVSEEHDRMVQHGVFIPVPINDFPADAKRLSSTWAMKQKPTERSVPA
jgi:hypothetical protein